LLRDASAMLGKCDADADPAKVVVQSPNDLHFDDPPLKDRPNHQKRALSYLVVMLLDDANVFISPTDLPPDYFATRPAVPLANAVADIGNNQAWPARAAQPPTAPID
jgi:hypothetical protein